MITANMPAIITTIAVSPITCEKSCLRLLPSTFLIPISFDLPTACAVARFIKFIQAIIIMKIPISDKVQKFRHTRYMIAEYFEACYQNAAC